MNQPLQPAYATPPGDTLAETLSRFGLSQTDLARRMGRPIKTINEIIQAKTSVTAETALALERVLNIPASTWSQLEANYREHLARTRATENLTVDDKWLSEVPVRQLQNRGWLPQHNDKKDLMEIVLRFFGVAGLDEWRSVWQEPLVNYRKSPSFVTKTAAIAAWIRRGELEGRKQKCSSYDSTKFRHALNTLRSTTLKEPKDWVSEIQTLCNDCGVAYVFVPELQGCHVSGATKWLRDDCALILQSGRHKDDGHFWFTFFHEARHVLQERQKKNWFIEIDDGGTDALENDANQFAAEHLVPLKKVIQLKRENGGKMPIEAAKKLAAELGIAPGIVAGHFQHEGYWKPVVAYKLKRCFNVDDHTGTIV